MNFAKKHKKEKLYVIVALKLGGVDGADSLLRFPPSKIPVQIGDAAKELVALCYNDKDATGKGSTEAYLLSSASKLTAAGSKMMASASEIILKKDKVTERGKDENSAIEARGEDDKVDAENDEDALEGGKRSH